MRAANVVGAYYLGGYNMGPNGISQPSKLKVYNSFATRSGGKLYAVFFIALPGNIAVTGASCHHRVW